MIVLCTIYKEKEEKQKERKCGQIQLLAATKEFQGKGSQIF